MKAAIDYFLDRAANNGTLETVITVFVLVSIEIIIAIIILSKLNKYLNSKCEEYSKDHDERKKIYDAVTQNTKDIIELRSDMNDSLTRIEKVVEKIAKNDDDQNLIIRDELAHNITDACNKVLDRNDGSIKASEVQTILRLFKSYSSPPINGNSYVHILVKQCINLKILNDGTEGYMSEYSCIKDEIDQMEE